MRSEHERFPYTESIRITCSKCQGPTMRRVARHGFLQLKIFPFFGYYPWECAICRQEKLFKKRGSRRSKRQGEDPI